MHHLQIDELRQPELHLQETFARIVAVLTHISNEVIDITLLTSQSESETQRLKLIFNIFSYILFAVVNKNDES